MIISFTSLISNASKDHKYILYVLHTEISEKNQEMVKRLANENFDIRFVDVAMLIPTFSILLSKESTEGIDVNHVHAVDYDDERQ